MKIFGLLAITLFALTFLGCGGNANQRAYERYQYDSARIEFIYPKEDTVDDVGKTIADLFIPDRSKPAACSPT